MSYETVRDADGNVLLVANFHEPIPLVALTNVVGRVDCAAEVPFTVAVGTSPLQLQLPNTPTLTLTGNLAGAALIVGAANITALAIPTAAGDVTLTAINLANLTFSGTPSDGITSFACAGAKLTTASVAATLAALVTSGATNGSLALNGGTNAAPVLDVAAVPGSFAITLAGLPSGGDYFTTPALTSGGPASLAFWMLVDGAGSAPGIGADIQVAIDSGAMSLTDIAAAIAAAVIADGRYGASISGVSGETISFVAVTAGIRQAVQKAGFTIDSELAGDNAHNSDARYLTDNGWTVTTN